MTRDEAIFKVRAAKLQTSSVVCKNQTEANAANTRIDSEAAQFVDAAVSIGMLKLDEPKIPVSKMLIAIECELSRQYDVIRSIKELDMCNPTAVRIGGMIDLEALAAAVELPAGEHLPPFYGTTRKGS